MGYKYHGTERKKAVKELHFHINKYMRNRSKAVDRSLDKLFGVQKIVRVEGLTDKGR